MSGKRPLSEISSNTPTSPSKIRSKKIKTLVPVHDRLEVFNLAAASVDTLVGAWSVPPPLFKKSNASLPSVVLPVGLDRLKFLAPEVQKWGPCKILSTRTQSRAGVITTTEKLVEGGTNNDAPRYFENVSCH
jgi:hypothetical protein